MRNLIPVDFASLGPVEFLWLFLAFGGLSILAPWRKRTVAAIVVGTVLAAVGVIRWFAGVEGTAWSTRIGPILVAPVFASGIVLLGTLQLPSAVRKAWLAALVIVSLGLQPFDLHPIDNVAEWGFLLMLGAALAALLMGRDQFEGWKALGSAACFLLFCLALTPFGISWLGALVILFVLWLVYAVVEQGREMQKYVIRRLTGAPVVLLLLLTLSFFLIRTAPGGPFDKDKRVDPAILKLIEAKYGLDDPLIVQYGDYMRDLVWEGDLGPSFKQKGRTVNEIISEHAPASARLGLTAVAIALLIGVTAGLISGIKQNSVFDYASMTVSMLGLALPTFIVGPMLVLLFALRLDWFGVTGWEDFPRDLVLPSITLALPFMARIARLTRAGMLEIVNQDYIRTARAKGLSEPSIVMRHTLKGTLLPVVSFLGPGIAQLLTGSLVVETIFGVPGMGKEFVQAALNRDYSLAMGLVLVFGTLLVLFNLIVDIAYGFLDPRIRHA